MELQFNFRKEKQKQNETTSVTPFHSYFKSDQQILTFGE